MKLVGIIVPSGLSLLLIFVTFIGVRIAKRHGDILKKSNGIAKKSNEIAREKLLYDIEIAISNLRAQGEIVKSNKSKINEFNNSARSIGRKNFFHHSNIEREIDKLKSIKRNLEKIK